MHLLDLAKMLNGSYLGDQSGVFWAYNKSTFAPAMTIPLLTLSAVALLLYQRFIHKDEDELDAYGEPKHKRRR